MGLGSGIRAGAAFVELKSHDAGFTKGLRAAERRLERFGSLARKVGAGLVAGGGSIVAAGALAAKVFSSLGDEMDKMSKRTGFSAESLSELGFAAEQSGSDLKTLEKGIKTMQRSIHDAGRGLSTQVDALGDLGLSYRDLADLSPEDQFKLIADRIASIQDPTKQAALSMQFLGRSGQQLLPLLQGGSAGMEELRQQARDLGLVVSGEAAAAAAEMTDKLNITKRVIKALVFEVGSALAPAILKTLQIITPMISGVSKWVKGNKVLVATVFGVASAVLVAGGAIIGLGLIVSIAGVALGGIATVITLVGGLIATAGAALAAILSPIGLVIAAVGGLAAFILIKATNIGAIVDLLGNVFGHLAKTTLDTLGAISRSIMDGDLELALKVASKGMEVVWASVMVNMKSMWLDFMALINKTLLDLPNIINALMIGLEAGIGVALGKGPGAFIGDGPRVPAAPASLKSIIDAGARSEKEKLQNELEALVEELKELNSRSPSESTGGGFVAKQLFESALEGFKQASTQTGTSARGVFKSSALQSLSSPVEKSIEANTLKTAIGIGKLTKAVKNSGGLTFG